MLLVWICMRFIAEGLDVNEHAGNQKFTPLHLAACNGEVSDLAKDSMIYLYKCSTRAG